MQEWGPKWFFKAGGQSKFLRTNLLGLAPALKG